METPEDAQTEFTVKLMNFSPDSKIKLIKEVKAQTEDMNLVQVSPDDSKTLFTMQSK